LPCRRESAGDARVAAETWEEEEVTSHNPDDGRGSKEQIMFFLFLKVFSKEPVPVSPSVKI
jgi:hypothetical protein